MDSGELVDSCAGIRRVLRGAVSVSNGDRQTTQEEVRLARRGRDVLRSANAKVHDGCMPALSLACLGKTRMVVLRACCVLFGRTGVWESWLASVTWVRITRHHLVGGWGGRAG